MKAITEFASFLLTRANQIKATLVTEGKTPEEIQASLGASFKLEGDKLTYFTNALEVATANAENLKRVFVVSLTEGENAPFKATKVEELYYVPDFHVEAKPKQAVKKDAKEDRPKRKGGDQPKTSPWGMSPEEKAAKAAKSLAAKAAAK